MCDSGCDTESSSDAVYNRAVPPPPPTSPAASEELEEEMVEVGEEHVEVEEVASAEEVSEAPTTKFPVLQLRSHLDPALLLHFDPPSGVQTFLAQQAFGRDAMVQGDPTPQLRPYEQHELRRKAKLRKDRAVAGAAPASKTKERAPAKRLRLAASLGNDILLARLLPACDPNAADELGRTALHIAACKGHNRIVGLLLAAGADPNQRDSIGNTPLHLAACTNHFDVVTSLLRAGTDVSAPDNHGRNPLQLAQSKLKLLMTSAAEPAARVQSEIRQIVEMMLEYFQKRGADSEAELVTALASRLTLADHQGAEVQALLANLSQLTLAKEPEGRRRFGSESEATMMSLFKVGGIGKRRGQQRKF